jgi:hypothetical protein
MGRYAQRRRSGGGPPGAPPLIQILEARADGTEIYVLYSGNVTDSDFELTDFEFTDGFQTPLTITNDEPETLLLTVTTTVDEGFVSYNGNVSGVLTPQTVELTIL